MYISSRQSLPPLSHRTPPHFQPCLTDCEGDAPSTLAHARTRARARAAGKSSDGGRGCSYLLHFLSGS